MLSIQIPLSFTKILFSQRYYLKKSKMGILYSRLKMSKDEW